MASVPYIAFLDPDNCSSPCKLSRMLKVLAGCAGVVTHDLCILKSSNQKSFWGELRSRNLIQLILRDLLTTGNGLVNSRFVICKSYILKIGGVSDNLNLLGFEDLGTWLHIFN